MRRLQRGLPGEDSLHRHPPRAAQQGRQVRKGRQGPAGLRGCRRDGAYEDRVVGVQ